jgi:hypothetical protein
MKRALVPGSMDHSRGIGMEISIPSLNLSVIAPEIVVLITALLVMI